jgi:glycosyltransferase involved in cell wall biosynthesis
MADIFCLPSLPRKYWQEQLGMVFLEAMACGKPIVSTLSGSIPEVVEDAGILVQPNDHTALYNALRNLLTDAALGERLRQKGMQRVESNFSLYEVSQRMRHLFRRLVSERAA